MRLVYVNPFHDLAEIYERLSRFLAPFKAVKLSNTAKSTMVDWSPSVDISETDEAYFIETDLPEVKKEDVKITFESGVLLIQGERMEGEGRIRRKIHRKERSCGRFLRSFSVPHQMDIAKLNVHFNDGVLHLHLPK
jgi:HSP20 family protein